jgi:hypothetical protein
LVITQLFLLPQNPHSYGFIILFTWNGINDDGNSVCAPIIDIVVYYSCINKNYQAIAIIKHSLITDMMKTTIYMTVPIFLRTLQLPAVLPLRTDIALLDTRVYFL